MRNNLVRLTTEDVSKAISITDTVIITNWLNNIDGENLKRGDNGFVQLSNVNNLITKFKKEFDVFGNETLCKKVLNQNTGNYVNGYILNEPQATFLIALMDNTNEKVLKLKIKLVKDFYIMKQELLARQQTRMIGKSIRNELTDVIKNVVEEGTNFKKFAYSNYTKLVYKKIFNSDVKKIKEKLGIKKTDNLRDFLTKDELDRIQKLESDIATFIQFTNTEGKNDKEIYQMVKNYVDNSLEKNN